MKPTLARERRSWAYNKIARQYSPRGLQQNHRELRPSIVRLSRPKTRIARSYRLPRICPKPFATILRTESQVVQQVRAAPFGCAASTYKPIWFSGTYPPKPRIAPICCASVAAAEYRVISSLGTSFLQGGAVRID